MSFESCLKCWLATSSPESIHIRTKAKPHVTDLDLWIISIIDFFNICVILMIIETAQWVGCWNMLTLWWPWPSDLIRDVTYIFAGIALRFASKKLLPLYDTRRDWDSMPVSFQWQRKAKKYAVSVLNFLSFLFAWAGLWDVFDLHLLERSFFRDSMFVLVPFTVGLLMETFLSEESLIYICAYLRTGGEWKKCTHVEKMDITELDEVVIKDEALIEKDTVSPDKRIIYKS